MIKKIELKSASVSKIRLYLRCPRRYYYAYGEGIFDPPTAATRFGNYVHEVLEDYLKYLVRTRKGVDNEALFGFARTRREEYQEIPATGGSSFAEADVVFNRFATRPVDPERIYGLERSFAVPLCETLGITFGGRIDRLELEPAPGKTASLHIIDYKTGKHKLSETELADDLQCKGYVLGSFLLYRKRFTEFTFSLFYLRDHTTVTVRMEYRPEYQDEFIGYLTDMKKDTEYEKSIAPHCKHCPARKKCKPKGIS